MRNVDICTWGYPITDVFRVMEPGDMTRETSEIKGESPLGHSTYKDIGKGDQK